MKIQKVPTPIFTDFENFHKAYKDIDSFFNSIQNEIMELKNLDFLDMSMKFEKRMKGLYSETGGAFSCDIVHYLLCNENVVASVFEMRKNLGNVRFYFFKSLESIAS